MSNLLLIKISKLFFIIIFILFLFYYLRGFEYFGLVDNYLLVEIKSNDDINIRKKIIIKLIVDKDYISPKDRSFRNFYDTLILFDKGKIVNKIPNRTGKNIFFVFLNDKLLYDNLGVWKDLSWYKYTYMIKLEFQQNRVKIKSKIKNYYEIIMVDEKILVLPPPQSRGSTS